MKRVSPHLHRADHFKVYAQKLESAIGGDHRLVFAAPPQHGKTQVTLHGLARIFEAFPTKRNAYITYNQERANSVSYEMHNILSRAGVVPTGTLRHMRFRGGGQCLFTSIDGGITGEPVDGVAIVDDPFKNRAEADSQTRRTRVEESYRSSIESRVHPGGSVIVLATRWHPADLSGVLVKEGWEYINLPAIAESESDPNGRSIGEALFPQMWPIEALEKKRAKVLDFDWSALYQGRPRPKGGKIFHDPTWYTRLPTEGYRGAYGVDLACTAKTHADYSVCLELWRVDRYDRSTPLDPIYYVVNVDRAQVEAPQFTLTLRARNINRRAWRMLWRASGMERGAAQFIQEKQIPLEVEPPPGDKLVSATAVAAAWNDGRVLLPDPQEFPEAESWIYAFAEVVRDFTGTGKEHDDDVDALGNAFAALQTDSDPTPVTGPSSRR